jgi:tRNA (mo5U34)-methyltransferase
MSGIKARHEGTTEAIRELSEELHHLGRYHTIELGDGRILPGLQTVDQLRWRIAQHPIPQDLREKRALDIGAWDGWFTFELERRGAAVTAVDVTRLETFVEAKRLLASKAEYLVSDVCKLDPAKVGTFDVVLFFGVLYHTKHPMLALERVCELTTDIACVESLVTDDPPSAQIPLMEFYEGTELAGQFDNWVCPNTACLLAFCRTAGFCRVELNGVRENRAHVTCCRKWPVVDRTGAPPELVLIENAWSRDHDFSTHRDDYFTVWFLTDETGLDCDNVFLEVGPYGCRPVMVKHAAGRMWQANAKFAPGLASGWNDVRIAAKTSQWSAPARVPVDLDPSQRASSQPSEISIDRVIDGKTYQANIVRVGVAESSVSAWVGGVADGVPNSDIALRLDGADLPATYVSALDDRGLRQVNAMVPMGTAPGRHSLSARVGSAESQAVDIDLIKSA